MLEIDLPNITLQSQGTAGGQDQRVLADLVSICAANPQADCSIDEIWDSIVLDLDLLNQLVNGEGHATFDRTWLYAVNAIVVICCDAIVSDKLTPIHQREIQKLLWRVTYGFDAILAGDIANIRTHVECEEIARMKTR